MKRMLIGLLALSLLLLVAAPAFAGHKPSHNPQGGGSGGEGPGGGTGTPSCNDGKGNHGKPSQNKHCYPGSTSQSNSAGKNASFATEAPQASGLTVGMAAIVAVGALGALLLVRRRWMFRTAR